MRLKEITSTASRCELLGFALGMVGTAISSLLFCVVNEKPAKNIVCNSSSAGAGCGALAGLIYYSHQVRFDKWTVYPTAVFALVMSGYTTWV